MKKAGGSIRLAHPDDRQAWDQVVDHPLQSWAWGEFRRAMGIDVVRLGVFQKEKLQAGWQLTFHRIPYTPWTIGYFPKGPLTTKAMLATLVKLARQKNAIFIQLEPNVQQLTTNNLPFDQTQGKQPTTNFVPSHHPLFPKYSFVLDLTKSEQELLSAMHPKTRYNLKVAKRHGVSVREDNSTKAFAAYRRLTQATLNRQGFYAHDQVYHRTMWQIMGKEGIAKLWTANYLGKTLAAWIIFLWKDTIYYPYGASSREHKETMAPNLLLWEIARWGKQNGYQKFDLWGALGPPPAGRLPAGSPAGGHDPRDPWFGFHRFKEGYHPSLVEFVGSYDVIINPRLYKLYTIADKLRWGYLNLFKRKKL